MRAAGYIRVSTTEQAEGGHSLGAQRRAIVDYCESRGWPVEIYEDAGFSGTSEARPAFQRLLIDADARRFDVILVWKLDRFSRDHIVQAMAMERFDVLGVRLIAPADGVDTKTSAWLDVNMRALFNEHEVRVIKERTRLGKRARARGGQSNASITAYGYQREKVPLQAPGQTEGETKYILKDPEPDPETASAVVLAFEAYSTGQHSDTTIADLLNRKGYKPSGRARSGRWTREGVRYLLTNPFYAGHVQHGDDLYPGQHEAIIDQELFDAVQAVRAQKRWSAGGPRRPERVYLLEGLAVCSECGLVLVSQTSDRPGRKAIAQYYCPSKRRSIPCKARPRLTRADRIDRQIGDLVRRLRLPDDWRDRLAELAEHREEGKNIEAERKSLQGALENVRKQHQWGHISDSEYLHERADLQRQLDALRPPERPAIEAAGETLETLGAVWATAPRRLRAEMLRTIFEEVRVDLARRSLMCVKPFAPFVPLFRMDGLEERADGCFYVREEDHEARSSC